MPARSAVKRLILHNFRSYAELDLDSGPRSVALSGPNGAGKTNLLEAISLLAPGRGLRRAPHAELARLPGDGSWAVAADVDGPLGAVRLGTGVEPQLGEARKSRIDGEPVGSAGAFAPHLRLVWLTPAMDGLFAGSASDRRRFLDRLVLAGDPEHGARVTALERGLRNRNRLLEDERPDKAWLDAVEREIAGTATAVAAARMETVGRLAALIAANGAGSAFPCATLLLEGTLETALAGAAATRVEDDYRVRLGQARPRDRYAGRTLEGPHLTDLAVGEAATGMPAHRCSTGEQKALLIGIVLAHARLVAHVTGSAPVLLLDEVAAHLDPGRRRALFEALEAIGAQAWLTAADAACFAELGEEALRLTVSGSRIGPA
jgi:DNA replication and repair protein RecF